jgi:hypothetical protein
MLDIQRVVPKLYPRSGKGAAELVKWLLLWKIILKGELALLGWC